MIRKFLITLLLLLPVSAYAWEEQDVDTNGNYPSSTVPNAAQGVSCAPGFKYSVSWDGTAGSATLTIEYLKSGVDSTTWLPIPNGPTWTTSTAAAERGTNITWAAPISVKVDGASGTSVDITINCIN